MKIKIRKRLSGIESSSEIQTSTISKRGIEVRVTELFADAQEHCGFMQEEPQVGKPLVIETSSGTVMTEEVTRVTFRSSVGGLFKCGDKVYEWDKLLGY